MHLRELALLDCANNSKFVKVLSKRPTTIFSTKHSVAFWRGFSIKDAKYFNISDTTVKRLNNVPVEGMSGGKLVDLKEKLSCGVVFFNDGLHFLYLIKPNGVYIITSKLRTKHKVDNSVYIGNIMSGFLYYDFYSDTEHCYINNYIDCLINDDNLKIKDSTAKPIIKALANEKRAGSNDLFKLHLEDYNKKFNDTKLCLQAFIFIHFAKIIDTTRISTEHDARSFTDRIKNKANSTVNIIRVDTLYDENLKVINPFSVSGHYRNQPYGNGRSETRLIYIDSFMKSGYTRAATKETVGV
jgi:hypothetical protein